jgi:4-amino-4-deoxy-L-arabinose transferase-like glycosyltransferase
MIKKNKFNKYMKNKNPIILISLILFLVIIFSYLISLNGMLAWDEVVYLSNARSKIKESSYTEDFRFPLLSTMIGGLWYLTGESIILAQIFMIITSIISLIIFYFISRYFLPKNTSLFATFIFGLSTQFITWGYRIYTDILGVCLTLISFLFILKFNEIRFLKKINTNNIKTKINNNYKTNNKFKTNLNDKILKKNNIFLFFAGIFAGLAFTTRLSTIVISATLSLFFIIDKRFLKNITIFSIGLILPLIPWFIHGFLVHQNALYFIFSQSSAIIEYTIMQSPLLLIRYLIKDYGLALILIFFNIIYFSKTLINKINYNDRNKEINSINNNNINKDINKNWFNDSDFKNKYSKEFYLKKIIIVLITLTIQLIFYLFYVKLKLARYTLEMSPFIIILIMLGCHGIVLISKKKHQREILTLLLILIVLSLIIPSFLNFFELKDNAKCTSNGAIIESISFLRNISSPGQTIISSTWPYHAYYLDLEAYSPWSNDIDEYLKVYDLKFIINSNSFGIPYPKEITDIRAHKIAEFKDECGWDAQIYKIIID